MAEPYKSREVVVIKDIYLAETQLKLKSAADQFAHNLFPNWPTIVKCCAEQGNDTTMLSAKRKTIGQTLWNWIL